MTIETSTPAQLAATHLSTMDSVNLITGLLDKPSLTSDDEKSLARNAAHVYIIKGKFEWTPAELLPFTDALTALGARLPAMSTEAGVLEALATSQS